MAIKQCYPADKDGHPVILTGYTTAVYTPDGECLDTILHQVNEQLDDSCFILCETLPETGTEGKLYSDGKNFYIWNPKKLGYDTIVSFELDHAIENSHLHGNKEVLDLITASYTTEQKDQLIKAFLHSTAQHAPADAQKNRQPDWNQLDEKEDDFILNKPNLGTASMEDAVSFATADQGHRADTALQNVLIDGNPLIVSNSGVNLPAYPTRETLQVDQVDNTADMDKPVSFAVQTQLDKKVDKIPGKGLSANDFTSQEKEKLAGIENNANQYLHPKSAAAAGTYKSVSTDDQGHIVAGSNPTTLEGYGITDAALKSHTHTKTQITDFPSAIKNPNSLMIQLGGTSQGGYDGSTAKTINITPSGIGAVDSQGATNAGKVAVFADTAGNIKDSGFTIASSVPSQAKFTDTIYSHPNSGISPGTYKSVSVDSQGHITAGSNPTTLAGYGITDAAPKSHTHTNAEISGFPASLKNPYSLTIQLGGTSQGNYDGSQAKTVNITPSSIGAVDSQGNTSPDKIAVFADTSGNIKNSGFTIASNVPAQAKFTDTVYTHPNSGVTAGTYKSVTVNSQGHITAGANPTTLSDYGITDAATTAIYHTTIGTSWNGSAAPYTQIISISGILSTDTPVIDCVLSSTLTTALLQEKAWNCVSRITTASNSITVYCNKKKPTTAIPIQLKVVR